MVGVGTPPAVVALDREPVSSSGGCAAADLCCQSPASESGLSWGCINFSFAVRHWHRLPRRAVGAPSLEMSKARLEKAWSLQSSITRSVGVMLQLSGELFKVVPNIAERSKAH